MRNSPLSISIGSRRSLPEGLEIDGQAGPLAPLAGRATERRHEPQVVEHHRPDVEDEGLGGLERLLRPCRPAAGSRPARGPGPCPTRRSTIWAWRTMFVRLWAGPSCIARAISRRRSSWASSSIRGTAASPSAMAADPVPRGAEDGAEAAGSTPRPSRLGSHGVAVAGHGPALALEDLDLRLHQGRALGEGDELDAQLGDLVRLGVLASARSACRDAPLRRDSWRDASALAWVTSRSISPSSRSRRATSSASRADSSSRLAGAVGGVVAGASVIERGVRASPGSRWISPPASGSSPGASRTRRPGSGR